MVTELPIQTEAENELAIRLWIDAAPAAVYRCWTDPELLVQWFSPAPWRTLSAETDPRPGGASLIVMEGPDGTRIDNPGLYLEVVPERRIVVTNAFSQGWTPRASGFNTVLHLTFAEAEGGGTIFTGRAMHWSMEDCATHERMGFHAGWAKAAQQLEDLLHTMRAEVPA